MLKRLSKSFRLSGAEKVKSPSAGANNTPASESSAKPDPVTQGATGKPVQPETIETASPSIPPTDANHVVSDPPTDSTPMLQAQTEAAGPENETSSTVDHEVKPSTNAPDSTPQNITSLPQVVSSNGKAEKTSTTEEHESTVPISGTTPAAGVAGDTTSSSKPGEHNTNLKATDILPVSQHEQPLRVVRRISFRSFAFFYGRDTQTPTSPTASPPPKANQGKPTSSPQPRLSRTEKQALSSALALRSLIMGPSPLSSSSAAVFLRATKAKQIISTPDLKKLKSTLLNAKSANATIAQLRRLPLPDGPTLNGPASTSSDPLVIHPDAGGLPIHAVCLPWTDEEADQLHFSRLRANVSDASSSSPQSNAPSKPASSGFLSVSTASLDSVVSVMQDLHLVSLLSSPDLGFGQPVTGEGVDLPLTGSIPSAGVIVAGFEEITKQLMSLGYATSQAVFPSHAGIYPPEDRMSVLTYWWGLELVLPEPSVKYLGKVDSISHAMINFLSALSLFNNGVREVLPFIRYISSFVDFEWGAIQAQDKGKGVVCAATWIMPAAMVPRPWDFSPRPASNPGSTPANTSPAKAAPTKPPTVSDKDNAPAHPPSQAPLVSPDIPLPPTSLTPITPMLMVTPATLPRSASPPQQQGVSA